MARSRKNIHSQIETVKKKISGLDYVIRGSVYKTSMPCGKPNCICKRDPSKLHGPYWYFTKSVQGRTKGRKLKKQEIEAYKKGVQQYKELRELIQEYVKLSEEAVEKTCAEE